MRKLGAQFATFVFVGGIAAVVHYGLLILLSEFTDSDPVFASACGFVGGGAVSYFLNYHLTFRSDAPHLSALPRFAAVAGSGLLLNTALMEILIHHLGFHYLPAQILTTGALMLWHFAINRLWTFSASHPRS